MKKAPMPEGMGALFLPRRAYLAPTCTVIGLAKMV